MCIRIKKSANVKQYRCANNWSVQKQYMGLNKLLV